MGMAECETSGNIREFWGIRRQALRQRMIRINDHDGSEIQDAGGCMADMDCQIHRSTLL